MNQPVDESDALVVQDSVIELDLVGLGFWYFEVLNTERHHNIMNILILHELLSPNFHFLFRENRLNSIGLMLWNNLKINKIKLEDEILQFDYLDFGRFPVAIEFFFWGLLREPMTVDDVAEKRTQITHILLLLSDDALAKFKNNLKSHSYLGRCIFILIV